LGPVPGPRNGEARPAEGRSAYLKGAVRGPHDGVGNRQAQPGAAGQAARPVEPFKNVVAVLV
jgi:hypothetical protein